MAFLFKEGTIYVDIKKWRNNYNPIRRIKMKSNYIKKQISIRLSQDEFNLFKELYRDRCMELEQYISKNRDAVLPIANDKILVACGFYHKRIISKIEMDLVKQRYSIFKFVEKINTTFVNFNECKYFWNMNTKRDLQEIVNYCANKDNQKDENYKI